MPDKSVVLVVEDEPLIRMMLADELIDAGYRVIEAADGDEALALLDARPDIAAVITDVRMPGAVDGVIVAQTAAQMRPGCAVIVVSGHEDPRVPLPAGAVFMRKPYINARLVRVASEMLAGRSPALDQLNAILV